MMKKKTPVRYNRGRIGLSWKIIKTFCNFNIKYINKNKERNMETELYIMNLPPSYSAEE